MIADLDETLRQLVIEELPVKNGEVEVKFDQPTREWSARLTRPTLNLFLYDLRENPILRQHQWQALAGNGAPNTASQKRTPMRVDCFYMLTSWANEPEDEHRLLTRALLALFRFPVLPADRLVGTLQNPPFDIQARLAAHDRLTNPAEVWSSLDNELRPSISYIITLALDPWSEVSGPVVRTFSLRAGQADELPRYRRLAGEIPPVEMSFIGGTVRSRGKGKEPLADVEVAIEGTGLFTRTDADGRFRFGGLRPGEYTLVASPEGSKAQKRNVQVQVPVKDGDYDLEI